MRGSGAALLRRRGHHRIERVAAVREEARSPQPWPRPRQRWQACRSRRWRSSPATASVADAQSPSTAICVLPPARHGSASPRQSRASSIRVGRWSGQRILLGPAVTKRLLFTGELIDGGRGAAVGLVDEVVDAEDGEERLATLTGVLAARSLLTQAATKSMVAEIAAHGHVSPAVQDHWRDVAAASPDGAEGVAAFVEKRIARFTWSGPIRWRLGQSRRIERSLPWPAWPWPCWPSSSSPCLWPG